MVDVLRLYYDGNATYKLVEFIFRNLFLENQTYIKWYIRNLYNLWPSILNGCVAYPEV